MHGFAEMVLRMFKWLKLSGCIPGKKRAAPSSEYALCCFICRISQKSVIMSFQFWFRAGGRCTLQAM